MRAGPVVRVVLLTYASIWAARSQGQEAIRISEVNEEAADARKKAAATVGYYNLKVGPTGWHFSTSLGLQADDNVNLSETSPKADAIFTPQLDTRMTWPLTELNTLNLNLGAGYAAYVREPSLSRFYILPGSNLSLDLYVGPVLINIHDHISMSQYAYQDPTVTGNGDASLLSNAAGLTAGWDVNDRIKTILGFDHADYVSLNGTRGENLSSGSELFTLSVPYALRSEASVGLEASGGITHFTGTTAHDANQWSIGAFVDSPVSEYIHVRANGGYTVYRTQITGIVPEDVNFQGAYGQLVLMHRLNQFVSYTLSGGRTVSFAFSGGTIVLDTANWHATWNLIEKTSLGTSFILEHGSQIGFGAETFDRFGPAVNIGRNITDKLSASLNYQFLKRSSDQPGRGYTANILSLNFSYNF